MKEFSNIFINVFVAIVAVTFAIFAPLVLVAAFHSYWLVLGVLISGPAGVAGGFVFLDRKGNRR